MTPLVVEATYEDGVLKPVQPLPLKEHDKLRLTVEQLAVPAEVPPLNLAKFFDEIEATVGLFEGPEDLAADLYHYLYGAPKTSGSDGH